MLLETAISKCVAKQRTLGFSRLLLILKRWNGYLQVATVITISKATIKALTWLMLARLVMRATGNSPGVREFSKSVLTRIFSGQLRMWLMAKARRITRIRRRTSVLKAKTLKSKECAALFMGKLLAAMETIFSKMTAISNKGMTKCKSRSQLFQKTINKATQNNENCFWNFDI